MKKSDGFITFVAILIVFGGLIEIIQWLKTMQIHFLAISALSISVGIGIFKLKKWALYGIPFLLGFGALIFFFSNKPNMILYIIYGFVVIFWISIYANLWQKRALFK